MYNLVNGKKPSSLTSTAYRKKNDTYNSHSSFFTEKDDTTNHSRGNGNNSGQGGNSSVPTLKPSKSFLQALGLQQSISKEKIQAKKSIFDLEMKLSPRNNDHSSPFISPRSEYMEQQNRTQNSNSCTNLLQQGNSVLLRAGSGLFATGTTTGTGLGQPTLSGINHDAVQYC